jgi:hypothetical protein
MDLFVAIFSTSPLLVEESLRAVDVVLNMIDDLRFTELAAQYALRICLPDSYNP